MEDKMDSRWKIMREWGRSVGREGMSRAAIDAVSDFDGSYKGVIILSGRMKAISQATATDDYWLEKMMRGYSQQTNIAEYELKASK